MKVLKAILLIILSLISVPCSLLLTFGCVWYTLPALSTTAIGTGILSIVSPQAIFWITIGCAILFTITFVLQKIFNRHSSAKVKNFFIHLNTWLMAILAIGLSIATFILATGIISQAIELTLTRKIGILIGVLFLLIYVVLGPKINRIINRKIQAYETAKESNLSGRGSVIFINLLKLLEVLCPEFIIIGILCFCTSWNIALYYVVVAVACLLPMIGNIEADFNIRNEIKRKAEADKEALAKRIANERGE